MQALLNPVHTLRTSQFARFAPDLLIGWYACSACRESTVRTTIIRGGYFLCRNQSSKAIFPRFMLAFRPSTDACQCEQRNLRFMQDHFLGAYVRHATACRDIVWTHTALHGPRWAMRLDVGTFILLQQLFSVMLECAWQPCR